MGREIRKVIETVLSIPISFSTCEIGFSTMNYIKDKKRSNLKLTSLENLARFKTNELKKLKEFDAYHTAIEWSRSHLFSDDSKSKLCWNLF